MADVRKNNKITHDHPACQGGAHRHEKVPVGGSAGGAVTEGCIDHYDERIVYEEEPITVNGQEFSREELKKYIVMGEILSSPKCKRR